MSHLADNVVRFAQLLRRAGISIGTGQVIDATAALSAVGVGRRDDVFWALHATLIRRREDRDVYAHAFDLFFRDPTALNRALAMLLPMTTVPEAADDRSRRVDEARRPQRPPARREQVIEELVEMAMTYSSVEVDRQLDFAQMSASEISAAQRAIARVGVVWAEVQTRRWRTDRRGSRVDLRATLRAAARKPGTIDVVTARRRVRPPPLVILCDVSGSMERYSRLFLHFAHAAAAARPRVHCFAFGTRLTNVTRSLRHRDIDVALDQISSEVTGARGGTRIGRCLHEFNRDWSRRVVSGAQVLLLSDGLERDRDYDLAFEADRLHRSCRRLIWLNPLLRFAGFEPKAAGIRALMPHVDEFRPVHNLASIGQLAAALGG